MKSLDFAIDKTTSLTAPNSEFSSVKIDDVPSINFDLDSDKNITFRSFTNNYKIQGVPKSI